MFGIKHAPQQLGAQKFGQPGEVISADQIHPRGLQLAPDFGTVRGVPEAQQPALGVDAGGELLEAGADIRGHFAGPTPFECSGPVHTDPGHEGRERIGFEIFEAPIDRGISQLLGGRFSQYLAKAAELLLHEPVCFDVVGPMHLSAMAVTSMPRNMRIQGRASRDEINSWYKEADVFVLPTISDGFALTQIEAMANGLPVITTPNCGDVVTDGVDGYIVAPRDPTALAAAIMRYVQDPGSLACHKEAAVVKSKQFTLSRLATSLLALGESLQG